MSSKKPPKKYNAAKLGNNKRNDALLTYVLGGVAIVAIIVLIVIFVVLPNTEDTEVQAEGYGSVQDGTPVKVIDSGGVLLGDPNAAVKIDAYEDFLCPACAQFEHQFGGAINQAIDNGQMAVQYHTLDFLNKYSASGDYSTRAAGAALCVADTGDGALYSKFHSALFQDGVKPEEQGSTDLSNAQLSDVAKQVGADDAVVSCIADGAKVDVAKAGAQSSMQQLSDKTGGQVSTPTVLHDGKKVNIQTADWIKQLTGQ